MKIVIFLGPSLDGRAAKMTLPGAAFRPPARRGDLYDAVRGGARVIGLVDGLFQSVPSVLHKEVLWALRQGCAVYGAASLGALRAAELHGFGMVGVGAIFAAFRDGRLWRDDEVAVIHGPAELGYAPLSEALVNIRATLDGAVAAGRIAADLGRDLADAAATLFYADRSLEAMCRVHVAQSGAALPAAELRWLAEHRIDQKAEDARALLETIGRDLAQGTLPQPPDFDFADTIFFSRFRGMLDNPLTRDLA